MQTKPFMFSTLNGKSPKLVNKFPYVGGSVSSTENDINMRLAKAWTAIERLSVIWKSDLSDKIKRRFFPNGSCPYYCMDSPHRCWPNVWRESLRVIVQECYELYWISSWGNIPQSSSCMGTNHPSRKPSKLDQQDMQHTAGEVSDVLMWTPSYGWESVGRPARTYLQQLYTDTGCSLEGLGNPCQRHAMMMTTTTLGKRYCTILQFLQLALSE